MVYLTHAITSSLNSCELDALCDTKPTVSKHIGQVFKYFAHITELIAVKQQFTFFIE